MRLPLVNRIPAAILAALAVMILATAQADAQYARPRHRAAVVAAPVYFGFGYGFYDPFWWGYRGWYPYGLYPYGWYGPYYWPPAYYAPVASARLQIKPRQAEVFLDGYFVGVVDDFDGVFQRLNAPPGQHDLTVYLEGYRTFTEKVLLRPGATLDIKSELQALPPGESGEPRPQPPAVERRPGRRAPPPEYGRGERRQAPDFGTLAIRVQPADAIVLVDGEEWTLPDGQERLVLELGEGPHDVEVRKDGFATFRRTVDVRAEETVSLNVSLSR